MLSTAGEPHVLNGRYRLEAKIGSGGMAVVYRARDLHLDRTVAVKLLHPQYVHDEAFRRRFLREARIAARVSDSPHIVTIFDVGREGYVPFIVMEYLDAPNLRQYLAVHGPLSQHEALAITRQIAAGLAAAHLRQVVHRDVKPQNILISAEGMVTIADFGIAAALSETRLTAPGIMLGSAHYMSPEQARGEDATAASDVYSLGILLFEMLAGSVPFDGPNPAAIAAQHVMAPLPALRSVRADVSADVSGLLDRMLAKDALARIPDAREVEAAIDRMNSASSRRPPPNQPPEPPSPVRRFASDRKLAALGLLCLLAALITMVFVSTEPGKPRQSTKPFSRPPAVLHTPVTKHRPAVHSTVAPTIPPTPVPPPTSPPAHVPPAQAPPTKASPAPAPAAQPAPVHQKGKFKGPKGDGEHDHGHGDEHGHGKDG